MKALLKNKGPRAKRTFKKRDDKGIIYIGNLPFGFYEENLKKFLSQFGEISRLKVKRSDKNAKPMGYAYVEFYHRKIATIVANTMHNYLMFSKLLKCHVVKGDPEKIFRKSVLAPELCRGTKNRRKNQFKLQQVKKENVLRKVKESTSKLSKVLGIKIGSRFLLQNSKNEAPGNINVEPLGGELTDKFLSQEGKQTSHDTVPITKKKLKIENLINVKEDITNTPETPNSQTSDSEVIYIKETPLYMDIEDEDDEIQLKTPPNVIKRYKNSVKIGSLKRKILGSNMANKSIKENDLPSSNDANQALERDSEKLKNVIAEDKMVKKLNSTKTAKNKISKKSAEKNPELKENKRDASQSSNQNIEGISGKALGKFVKQKRKFESVKDEQIVKSKKFKLNSKKVEEERNPKDDEDEIQLMSSPTVIKIGSNKKKILESNRASKSVKENKFPPSNDTDQAVGKDSKKLKKASMEIKNNENKFKSDTTDKIVKNKVAKEPESTGKFAKKKMVNKSVQNKIGKKSLKRSPELKANKCNVRQSNEKNTEFISPKVLGKLMKQKGKAESVKDVLTVKSKKMKLNSRKIKKGRSPNSRSKVKLVSFKNTAKI